MKSYEKRIKRLEQNTQAQEEEKPLPPEIISLIERISGTRMPEEEKHRPCRKWKLDDPIPAEIEEMIANIAATAGEVEDTPTLGEKKEGI